MLDPRFKELLTSGQTEHAKKEFLRYVKNDESDDSDTPVTPPAGRTTDDDERLCHFDLHDSLLLLRYSFANPRHTNCSNLLSVATKHL